MEIINNKPIYGIGIESSCDETGIAISQNGNKILANPVYTQIDFHAQYGGVVPESASRLHLEKIAPMLQESFSTAGITPDQLSYVAVTVRPGLVGSLLVGYYTARALADFYEIPLIPIHHLEAHLYAIEIAGIPVQYPFLGLLLSGGNSAIYKVEGLSNITTMGDTLDDAAGEALDKAAALLNLSYPGGPVIEKLARSFANKGEEKFDVLREKGGVRNLARNPLPKILATQPSDKYEFSFSGIKTALYYLLEKKEKTYTPEHLAWAFQERVFEIVLRNVTNALTNKKFPRLVAAGGVLANQTLKKQLAEAAQKTNTEFISPPPELCTDNGAMIAALGFRYFQNGNFENLSQEVTSSKKWGV
ncbi:MAG: tRNA (adenosine(37)-N6)-threonylcarbamoyltransferase complex transferase subunit TsaD [Leptospirales bacterium]